MEIQDRLKRIREEMTKAGVDAYVIPSSDPHMSEYLPDRYKCIAWSSGFTGSAGTLVITQDFAGLWTDARYFVQGGAQLKGTGYELVKLKVQGAAEYAQWLGSKLSKGATVAFDGMLASVQVAMSLKDHLEPLGITIDGNCDLISKVWTDRPELPKAKMFLISKEWSGQTAKERVELVRKDLADLHADGHLISTLDDTAWLLNIRGRDVPCNPVVLSFVYVSAERAILFVDTDKVQEEDLRTLNEQGIEVAPYDSLEDFLTKLEVSSVCLDPKRTCYSIFEKLAEKATVIEAMNPSTMLKAIKNEVEVGHMRQTMVKDGVALTKFFKWLEENVQDGALNEISIADKLQSLREAQEGFVDISFGTIAAYKDHAALPHYSATKEAYYDLQAKGMLLVDSGGQYTSGTTDITRVVPLGETTQEEQEDYTLVLKAMIDGSLAIFPEGTRGYQIDAITRQPLWQAQKNYGHGTGHGIGFFLNVHEGPHVFNMSNVDIPVQAGMISSIEPGIYREGKYGIRIENLVLCKPIGENEYGKFQNFETLTLCYIDTSLVKKELLSPVHIAWLNKYHELVYSSLKDGLEPAEREWLKQKTQAI